jgi:hypothetical protein
LKKKSVKMLNLFPPHLKPSGGRRGGLRTPLQLASEEREDVEARI